MRRPALLAAAVATLALGGCASAQDMIAAREHLLAAAGFHLRPAAAMPGLPAQQLVWRRRHRRIVFLYADPVLCRCVFEGSEKAYQTYRRMEFEDRVAAANRDAAEMNQNAATWGPWPQPLGPPPYGWWW